MKFESNINKLIIFDVLSYNGVFLAMTILYADVHASIDEDGFFSEGEGKMIFCFENVLLTSDATKPSGVIIFSSLHFIVISLAERLVSSPAVS